eukprot:2936587-Rhodomonas_salina.1
MPLTRTTTSSSAFPPCVAQKSNSSSSTGTAVLQQSGNCSSLGSRYPVFIISRARFALSEAEQDRACARKIAYVQTPRKRRRKQKGGCCFRKG